MLYQILPNDMCLIARRVATCQSSLKNTVDLHESCHRRLNLQGYIFKDAIVRWSNRETYLWKNIFNAIPMWNYKIAFLISLWDISIVTMVS